jgi:hypothetical protein
MILIDELIQCLKNIFKSGGQWKAIHGNLIEAVLAWYENRCRRLRAERTFPDPFDPITKDPRWF